MQRRADSYSCKQSKHALSLSSTLSSAPSYSQTTFFSILVFSCSTTKPSKTPSFSTKFPSLSTSHIDLSNKLGKDGKLNGNEQKHCINNNLCLYCRLKEHKVNGCLRKQSIQVHLAIVAKEDAIISETVSENQCTASKTQYRLGVAIRETLRGSYLISQKKILEASIIFQ